MSILCILQGHRWHTKRQCFQKVRPEHDFESYITWDQCVRCQDTRSIVANPESEHSRYAKPTPMHHENMPLEQPIPHTPMAVRFIRWVRIVMAELRDPEPVRVGHEVERKGP
jgi:hypothetical protein